MFAIAVRNPGKDYDLVPADITKPEPGPHDILIKTAAAGINRADLLQAKGYYPPPPGAPETLGMELSGVVEAVGGAVTGWRMGDRVCALVAGGAYAEYAVAPEATVLPIPHGFSVVEAASLPEAYFTVWTNLYDAARLKPGDTVLIHGGSSGIGTAAIQLCRAQGFTVFTTAASDEKCAACVALGANHAINYQNSDFVAAVTEITGGRGADVILDMVGGDYIARNFAAAAPWGRIVNIAFQKGATATVDFSPMIQKRLTFAATTLRGRTIGEKRTIRDAVRAHIWPLIEAGKIKPVIDKVFPLAEAGIAHAHMAKGGHVGKILLSA